MLQAMFGAFRRLLPGGATPVLERREIVRVECKVPVVCIFPAGGEMNGTVIDMGMRGVRLETKQKLKKGNTVRLLRPDGGPVECLIVWTRPKRFSDDFLAGLQFIDSAENLRASWIKGTLKKLGFTPGRIKEKRKHIRVPSELRAALVSTAGDELCEGTLINLGIGGALVALPVEVPSNVKVSVRIDPVAHLKGLELPCAIRSCRKNPRSQKFEHGLRFEDQDNDTVKQYLNVLMKSV